LSLIEIGGTMMNPGRRWDVELMSGKFGEPR
jgi:hypothetical protein